MIHLFAASDTLYDGPRLFIVAGGCQDRNWLANYFIGQVVGQMDRVRPARQVVLDMVTEYADVVRRFAEQVGHDS